MYFLLCRNIFETNSIPKDIIKISVFCAYDPPNINPLPFSIIQTPTGYNS